MRRPQPPAKVSASAPRRPRRPWSIIGLTACLVAGLLASPVAIDQSAAQPGAERQPEPGEVSHTVTCLQGAGRVDTTIANTGANPAVYRIEFQGMPARERTVAPGDWWRMPVTGRSDGSLAVGVRRDGVAIADSELAVSCSSDPPIVSTPEVTIITACRDHKGYVLFQFANPSVEPRGYVIRFAGVPNRSTTAAAYGGAVRAVTGRADGSYAAEVLVGGSSIHRSDVEVDCATRIPCEANTTPGAPLTQLGSDLSGEAFGDMSAWAVATNAAGDRIIVGAPHNDAQTGILAGHARVYEIDGTGQRRQLGDDIDGESAVDASGWSVDMNAAGDMVIIGAHHNDGGGGLSSGHARIYALVGERWEQVGADVDGKSEGEQSGYSVAMNAAGDRVVIGARLHGLNSGTARIYALSSDPEAGQMWRQIGADINGEAPGDQSGWSVDMNAAGDMVIIGAPFNNGESIDGDGTMVNNIDSGHARIYRLHSDAEAGEIWSQVGADIDGESIVDESGWSVAMNAAGDRVVVGAPSNEGSARFSGHVRVYEFDGVETWVQVGADIDGERIVDFSGAAVAMNASGDTIMIGASGNDGGGNLSGHARIYRLDPEDSSPDSPKEWSKVGSDIDGKAEFDFLGHSVAINAAGDRAIVGAPGSDIVIKGAGYVRILEQVGCV